jgi:menaquinone-dependent protoporphyrinogen IX oxidase
MKKVLIAYCTKTNTTKEIALEIAGVIKENDFEVDVLDMAGSIEIEGYDAAIIGSPINGMMWLPQAMDFVTQNQEALQKIPVAYFSVSYIIKTGSRFWQNIIRNALKKPSNIIKPIKTATFGGRVDGKMPGIMYFMFGIRKDASLDVVDMDEVKSWSVELTDTIK